MSEEVKRLMSKRQSAVGVTQGRPGTWVILASAQGGVDTEFVSVTTVFVSVWLSQTGDCMLGHRAIKRRRLFCTDVLSLPTGVAKLKEAKTPVLLPPVFVVDKAERVAGCGQWGVIGTELFICGATHLVKQLLHIIW